MTCNSLLTSIVNGQYEWQGKVFVFSAMFASLSATAFGVAAAGLCTAGGGPRDPDGGKAGQPPNVRVRNGLAQDLLRRGRTRGFVPGTGATTTAFSRDAQRVEDLAEGRRLFGTIRRVVSGSRVAVAFRRTGVRGVVLVVLASPREPPGDSSKEFDPSEFLGGALLRRDASAALVVLRHRQ